MLSLFPGRYTDDIVLREAARLHKSDRTHWSLDLNSRAVSVNRDLRHRLGELALDYEADELPA